MTSSRARWLLRAAISIALLTLVIARMDAGRFGALAARVHWGWWTLGLAVELLSRVASAQRSRLLIRHLGHRVSLGSVAAVNLEAIFFSLMLPSELLAGIVRWGRFARHLGDRTATFTLLAGERLIDAVLLALVAAAGTPLFFAGDSAQRLRGFTAVTAAAIAVLGGAAVLAGRSRFATRAVQAWRSRGRSGASAWVEHLARLLAASRTLAGDARQTAAVLFWTVAYWCVFLIGGVVMARAVFPQMPALPYVAATAAMVLLTQIPLTIAGVGLRELSLPVLLAAHGVTDEVGLLVGLSAFVPYALLGVAGFVLRLIGRARLREDAPR